MQFPSKGKKILVIDKNTNRLDSIASIINKHLPDCKTLTINTENRVISSAIEEQPDTIILNPDISDFEDYDLCSELKKNQRTQNIPIIILTDFETQPGYKEKVFEIGADAFLYKPISEIDLLTQVNTMLRIKHAEDKLRADNALQKEETKNKKKGEDWIKSEEMLQLIFENSPLSTSITDLKGNFIDVNQSMCNLLGYSKEELLNKHFNFVSHPDDHQKNLLLYKKLVQGIIPFYDFEKKYVHKNGQIIHVLLRSQIAKNKNGKPLFEIAIAENISSHHKSELILQEKEENLRLIIENSPIGVSTTDLKGYYKDVNPALCKMVGYSREEMIGKHFNTFSYPDDAQKNTVLFNKLVKGEIPYFDLEKRYLNKKNKIVTVLIRAQIIRDKNGDPLFQTALIENITEQKKITLSLKENEQKFRDLANLLPQMVYEIDLEGNLTFANKIGLEAFGYNKNEIESGFNMLSVIAAEDHDRVKDLFQNIHKGSIAGNPDYTAIRKDGSRFPVSIYSSIIFKDNKPKGVRGIIVDMSDWKRAERLQKVLYNISNAAITLDNLEKLIGFIQKELGTIIDTTNFYVALYDAELDVLTLPFFADEEDDLDYIPKGKSLTRHVFETKQSLIVDTEIEKELVQKGIIREFGSPSKIWLGVPLKLNEKVIGVLAVQSYHNKNAYNHSDLKILEFVSDQISLSVNRKKADDELKAALEKAKESDKLKSAFLATMSHELRTPLNAIIGFSEFLTKELESDSVEKFGEIIYKSGKHLLSIVNDLFDITLIESGEAKISKEEVLLNSLFLDINDVIIAKQYRDGKDNIELKYTIPKELDGFIFKTDQNKLKQVFINLLKNALKFTNEGFVHYGCEIIYEDFGTYLKFYVRDSGIGIHKDKQRIIFDLFRQAEDSRSRKYDGTGIGLSVAKRLVELLDGNIWVESKVNEGSTFYFIVPVENIETETIIETGDLLFYEPEKIILIVEDNLSSAKFIRLVLEKAGLNCLNANNGLEAVEICEAHPDISLVLMDINMPLMDGLTATKKIKTFKPELPIIAQTAHAITGDKEKALNAGCDDYISKPINHKELLEKVKLFLQYSPS